jgi:hypothetical protein
MFAIVDFIILDDKKITGRIRTGFKVKLLKEY